MNVKTLMIAVLGAGLIVYSFVWKNRAIDELHAIQRGWRRSQIDYMDALQTAKTNDERRRLAAEQSPNPEPYAMRCLELAEAQGDSALGLAALWWAACNAPKSDPGRKALAILESDRLARAELNEVMFAIERATPFGGRGPTSLVRLVLERVKLQLDHPQAARLLTWVCANDYFERGQQESPTFAEAADLIVAHFAGRPDIQHFCRSIPTQAQAILRKRTSTAPGMSLPESKPWRSDNLHQKSTGQNGNDRHWSISVTNPTTAPPGASSSLFCRDKFV